MVNKAQRNSYLIEIIKDGNRDAMVALVKENVGLIHFAIRKWASPLPPSMMDDLLQDGRIAIMRAVDTYDQSKGLFSNWCTWQIRGSLMTPLRQYRRALMRQVELTSSRYDEGEQEYIVSEPGYDPTEDIEWRVARQQVLKATIMDLATVRKGRGVHHKKKLREYHVFRAYLTTDEMSLDIATRYSVTRQRISQIIQRQMARTLVRLRLPPMSLDKNTWICDDP